MLRSLAWFACLVCVLASSAWSQGTIGNYLGQKGSVPQGALGARAKFLDRSFQSLAAPGPNDVVVWQDPLPGDAFAAAEEALFLVTDKVPVPEIVGMQVGNAQLLLAYVGLSLSVVTDCDATGHPPTKDEQSMQVTMQCVPPGTMYDPGNFVGVIINPWPEGSSALLITLIAVAAAAALAALIFFMRARFAQQELDVFKQGRNPPPG